MKYLAKSLTAESGIAVVTLEAGSRTDAERQVVQMGHFVLSITPVSALHGMRLSRSAQFPLLLFNQELLFLLDSGINIVEALETLAEKEVRAEVRAVLQEMLSSLQEGRTFSDSLDTTPTAFPPLYVATVRASERTGGLSEALGRYISYANQIESLKGKLVSAAIYPFLLVGVSSLVILFLMGYVVPRFSHIYEDMGSKLPFLSRVLLHWGQLVEHYWPALIALLASVAIVTIGGRAAIARWGMRLVWRLPAVGEKMRVFQLARLYRTLGMLLRGGISMVPALEMVAGLLTDALQESLRATTKRIREGGSISQAFESGGLSTPVALRMLRVGERAGNMGDMMERIAAFHDEEMARWAEWVTRLLGPLLMLAMGILIGAIVILMYLPIFQMAESIG